MDKITIRNAVENDCPRMLELITELAVYERAPDAVTVSLAHFAESGFGEKPVWWAFVAEENNMIIGFALYFIRYSTWKGQRMYLEDLLVTEKARGKGVGKLLFDELLIEARQRNMSGLAWQVLDWNEPAINFYKKYNAKMESEWLNGSLDF